MVIHSALAQLITSGPATDYKAHTHQNVTDEGTFTRTRVAEPWDFWKNVSRATFTLSTSPFFVAWAGAFGPLSPECRDEHHLFS